MNNMIEFESIKDLVSHSETIGFGEKGRQFEYNLNEKNAKAKLLKGAKRSPFEIVQNNGSVNLIFNLGSWKTIVSPSILYWKEVRSDMTCTVGQSKVKLASVKTGRDVVGKHVDTQIVFFFDREKAVCHFYNTTQLILVNGHGYIKFVEEFLRPYFESKIAMNIRNITTFNEQALEVLGSKKVKRASVRYKGGSTYPCGRCDFAAQTITALAKHSKEHALDHSSKSISNNSLALPVHSTRNNSIIGEIMQEDMTISNISRDETFSHSETLKYTCLDCEYKTREKSQMDEHVVSVHAGPKADDISFICGQCSHKFSEREDYNTHMKTHDNQYEQVDITEELVTDHTPRGEDSHSTEQSSAVVTISEGFEEIELIEPLEKALPEMKCNMCKFTTQTNIELQKHKQTVHQDIKVDIHRFDLKSTKPVAMSCNICNYQCTLNRQLRNHMNKKHINEETMKFKCYSCDFQDENISTLHEHKVNNHPSDITQTQPTWDKDMILNHLLKQNMELIKELANVKKTIDEGFKQLSEEVNHSNTEYKKSFDDVINKITRIENNNPVEKETSKATPVSHISKPKSSPLVKGDISKRKTKTSFLSKPKLLLVGDSVTHSANIAVIEKETNSRIKTCKAYSSVEDATAMWPHKNITDVSREALANTFKDDEFSHLVLAAPTVDITNLDTTNLQGNENIEFYKQKVFVSCQNMFTAAKSALDNNQGLETVVIMEHPPRFDVPDADPTALKPRLAKYANTVLADLHQQSSVKNRIVIGKHSLTSESSMMAAKYRDDFTGRFDGVHMYGSHGVAEYTKSIVQIIKNILPPSPPRSSFLSTTSYHDTCPQAQYQKSLRKQNIYNIPVRNQFQVLTN